VTNAWQLQQAIFALRSGAQRLLRGREKTACANIIAITQGAIRHVVIQY